MNGINNLFFLSLSLKDWEDFFPEIQGPSKPTLICKDINPKTQSDIQIPNTGNVYILHCFFNNLTSETRGSAICIEDQENANILIETSTFIFCNCDDSSSGGTIYLSCKNCALYQICAHKTKSSNNCGFCGIWSSEIHSMNESTISSCVSNNANTALHQNGYPCYHIVNSSNNCAYQQSACSLNPTRKNDENIAGTIFYSTFFNDSSTWVGCIAFSLADGELSIIHTCNFINNSHAEENTKGLIQSNNKIQIQDSCILQSFGSPLFGNCDFILINVTLDKLDAYNTDSVNTEQIGSESFINKIKFYETENCADPPTPLTCNKCPTLHIPQLFDRKIIVNDFIICFFI